MTLADVLNSATEYTFDGKTYKVREPTVMEQGEWQRWMEMLAFEAIERNLELSDERKDRALAHHYKNCSAGDYEWGSELCVRRLQTVTGLAKLMSIVLRDQGLTEEMAHKWADTHFKQCVAMLIKASRDDPKELRAVLASLGLPPDFLSSSPTPPSATESTTSVG